MKIAIVKTSSLGDIVHAFPALSLLRKTYPSAQIDWVVEKPFAELVESHPYVGRVIPIQTKKWRKNLFSRQTFKELKETYSLLRNPYDLLFDLQGNTKSAMVTALTNAKIKVGYGFQTVWEYPNLAVTNVKYNPPIAVNVRDENLFLVKSFLKTEASQEDPFLLKLTEEQSQFLQQFLSQLKPGRRIFVAPGSNWKNKQADEGVLAEFLQLLNNQQESNFLLIYGNEEEKRMAERISSLLPTSTLVDKLPLQLLQNLMSHMDLVVAMDSLPLHLAATAGVPTYGIFGPSSAAKFAPVGHRTFQGICPYNRTFSRRCPILRTCASGACIKNISGRGLFDTFLKTQNFY